MHMGFSRSRAVGAAVCALTALTTVFAVARAQTVRSANVGGIASGIARPIPSASPAPGTRPNAAPSAPPPTRSQPTAPPPTRSGAAAPSATAPKSPTAPAAKSADTEPPTPATAPTTSGPGVTIYALHRITTLQYLRPTQRPITDPWRAPPNPYAAGNRGIEFGTVAGDVVLIPADGVVTFSGRVAGTYYLVTQQPDGLRLTLGGLASTPFQKGESVYRGQQAGVAAGPLHAGIRLGDIYADPTNLFVDQGGPPRLIKASTDR